MDQNKSPVVTDSKSLRAPQGVWMQNGKLFVADAQNHRVLIWNSIPTANEQPADIVLGQDNMNAADELDPIKKNITIGADSLLTPTSVSSDGVRLFVTDLGLNRVLIWNTIPTRNHQPADIGDQRGVQHHRGRGGTAGRRDARDFAQHPAGVARHQSGDRKYQRRATRCQRDRQCVVAGAGGGAGGNGAAVIRFYL